MGVQVDASGSTPFNIVTYPIKPSLIVGSAFGVAGLAFGSLRGVASGRRPIVSALTVGGTWFGFAQVFWYTRLVCGRALTREGEVPTSSQKLLCSTAAGGISGAINGTLQRGIRHAFPTAVFLSSVSFLGQAGINTFASPEDAESTVPSLKDRVAKSAWNPLKPISEDEYEKLLVEKLKKTKADIAAVDEKIKAARASMATRPNDEVLSKN